MITQNGSIASAEMMRHFGNNNMILFLGIEWKNELSDEIASLPWNCVITTSSDKEVALAFFNENRQPIVKSKYDGQISFDRKKLQIIYLRGDSSEIISDSDDFDELMIEEMKNEQCKRLLQSVFSRMDIRSDLVILGYNPTNEFELSFRTMRIAMNDIQNGNMYYFGAIDCDETRLIIDYVEKRGGKSVHDRLSELISGDAEPNYIESDSDERVTFYKSGKPIQILRSTLIQYRNFMQLLTDECVYETRPYGRIEQARWYYNFLNLSGESPQWYGYFPQSEFYLKRDYEDTLINVVEAALAGKLLPKHFGVNSDIQDICPIILQGNPSTSKSVELAALAYKTYIKHFNPVIYIKNENLKFADNSTELRQLDELMHDIEQKGESDPKFLIIWDSSSYCDVSEIAVNLMKQLRNRGRRIVLVCSAYTYTNGAKSKWFSVDNRNEIVHVNREESNAFFDEDSFVVNAPETMSDKEIIDLRTKVRSYSVADSITIKQVWERVDKETSRTCFDYFYRLIGLIRPRLEHRLTREQTLVFKNISDKLDGIDEFKEEVFRINPFADALKELGLTIELPEENDNEIEEDYDVPNFFAGVALFSRFKLDTPYTLALKLLCKDNYSFFGESSRYDNKELFAVLTSQIPSIHYFEVDDNKFVFRYRNTLEAGLYFERNGILPREQIELICSMLEYYAQSYQRNGDVEIEWKEVLARLLRLVGPNSDYYEFNNNASLHNAYLNHMELVIEKLKELRTVYKVPDEDKVFEHIEITFLREYYGNLWDRLNNAQEDNLNGVMPWIAYPELYTKESYLKRIKMLKVASDMASDTMRALEITRDGSDRYNRKYLQDQISSLAVEQCLCNQMIEYILDQFSLFIEDMNIELTDEDNNLLMVKPLSYRYQYEQLVTVINSTPLNGYAYNTLFKMFRKEYKKYDGNAEKQLQLLTDVRMYADDANTLPIISRGPKDYDELSMHISFIIHLSGNHEISISDIENGNEDSDFHKLLSDMISRNNPAALCFVCQQELDKAKLSGKDISQVERENQHSYVLSKEQVAVCDRVVRFLQKPEYRGCIEKNPQALYLLLRVEWMLFNKRPLSTGKEHQRTYLSRDNWIEIQKVCEAYENCCGERRKPVVTLLNAICQIQLRNDYLLAHKMLNALSEALFLENSISRMRVPYLICFEDGSPHQYTGKVLSTKGFNGFIQVDGLPQRMGNDVGVRFNLRNIGQNEMPEKDSVMKMMNLGVGYTGFAIYIGPASE